MTKSVSYKFKLAALLLGLCLTHVLCETEAYESWTLSHTSLPHSETTATKAEPATENVYDGAVMVLRENVTALPNVGNVTVSGQTENNITLEWSKVDNILTYRIQYIESGDIKPTEEAVNGLAGQTSVEHVVKNLNSGTTYNFTLFTVSGNGSSSDGYNFTAATAPRNVDKVTVLWQSEINITLQWSKVDNIVTYRIQYIESGNIYPTEEAVNGSAGQTSVEHVVKNLNSGTTYNFTLFTVSGNVDSSGLDFTAVTAPENVHNVTVLRQNETSITLQWSTVKNILTYKIQHNDGGLNPTQDITGEEGQTSIEYVVSNLTDGTVYNFILLTLFSYTTSTGYPLRAVTAPSNALDFKPVDQNETSITLQWSKVNNISNYVLKFNGTETAVNASGGSESVESHVHSVSSLMIGTLYNFTLLTVFEDVNSSGENISAATAPRMVDHFEAVGQNETSITLQWRKVNKSDYVLYFNGSERNLTAEDESELVFTYNVSPLHATNEYDFTVFTVLNKVRSTGKTISAVTAPSNVPRVVSTKRFLTNVALQWIKVHENTTYILEINGRSIPIHNPTSVVTSGGELTYTVEHLKPGTEYNYTLYTVFKEVNSSGVENVTVTVIDCAASHWIFDNSSIKATIEGVFSYGNANNGSSESHLSPGGSNVSFTGLYPGSTYEVSLWYRAEGLSEPYLQCEHSITIIPPDIQVHCDQGAAAYAIFLSWDGPEGRWTQVEVNVTGDNYTVGQNNELTATITRLQPAKTYKVSAVFAVKFNESGILRKLQSKVAETTCSTYTGGVIAGSVMAVLLFCLLVCLAVFIWRRKPDIFRKESSYMGSSKRSSVKFNDIPVEKFPDYFYEMSRDEDRAFIEEYESFFPVGTEQTQKTADLSENRPKNRFTNVLPYDWSRVKLSTIQHDETSDYVNACYMPGYGSTRQYIAAQGPLPSTVNEFWRMIWEQRVKGVVMVTNCTEGGRVKCDQYWPLDSTPCRYGDLIVTINSEHKGINWTIREFGVKHMETSEERTVKQFHFTAWPDHGVPEGTEALIEFRGLVRQHIESEGARAPTVVHCSAGVGRTGTIIALDVLLQQLEQEGKVGVASFVHKMRLSRPLMVQTESQYTFLHQCILNYLESKSRPEEHLYENAEMIYENATALKEFHQSTKTNV